MKYYGPSLSETLNKLKAEGYTEGHNPNVDCLNCRNVQLNIYASDFLIDQFFSFEGQSDPADGAIRYEISSEKYNVKGVLVNGYGIYSESLTKVLLSKMKNH